MLGLVLLGALTAGALGLALLAPEVPESDPLLGLRDGGNAQAPRGGGAQPLPLRTGRRVVLSPASSPIQGEAVEPQLLRDLIALGTEDLGSPMELEDLVLPVVVPFARLEAVTEVLARGLLTTSEERLTPAERGALRAIVLGAHLHREPRADPALGGRTSGERAELTGREQPAGQTQVELLLERVLSSATGWTEPLRARFAQLATSLLGNGRCCLEPSHARTLLSYRAEDARLAPWCDRLLACALGHRASREAGATARTWLGTPPSPETVGPALRALFAAGEGHSAWALAEALWSERRTEPAVRAGVLQAVAAAAPLPSALDWLESRSGAGDVGASIALASRPGAQQAALERYGELLEVPPESDAPEGRALSNEARTEARRVMVSALTDPRLLTDLACTDPAPAVRGHAHLSAAQAAGPIELQRLVTELQREHLLAAAPQDLDPHAVGRALAPSGASLPAASSEHLSADARALIALTHARRAGRVGAPELQRTCLQLAEELLESSHLGRGTAAWLRAALGSQRSGPTTRRRSRR